MTFKGHNIRSVLLAFRSFTAELSRIAAVSTPGDPVRASPRFFRTGAGHQVGNSPLASLGILQYPHKSASTCGAILFVASYDRSLSLRPSGSLAILADRTGREPGSPPSPR